ncbi:MAG TPA: PadR family transcriptional regulator [Ktedonobacteraceae bacterium]|jgi:DNA-binding PadR family transcriptional regulator|nr:PadR family transcriptional regulator [Ktedonobacteraceae bacterium]
MSLKYVLLGLLTHQPEYGYELKRKAEQLLGNGAELNPGQLYPLLRRLADQQLIAGERIEQEDRPDKRIFTLTEAGRQGLFTWLDEPVPLSVGRPALFLRFVVLLLVRPEARADFLKEQRHRLLDFIGQLVADRAKHLGSEDLSTRALRELTVLHAEADLKWIEWLETLEA